jgi:segregation and condensation protein B
MNRLAIKSALESMMFIWGEPLDYKSAADVLECDKKTVYECFLELRNEYIMQNRGIQIIQTDKKFQFGTKKENYEYIERLCAPIKERRLSQSALETLAIIAYKQPVTKAEIEDIRGIKSLRVLEGLMLKGLIEEKGRDEKIGKPILYGTTDLFLQKFGFKNLSELPDIEEIEKIISRDDEEVQQIMLDFQEA